MKNTVSIKRNLKRILYLAAICLLSIPLASFAADKKPNVLFIMTDDLRPQLGCYGDPTVKTPCLDAFAENALRFDNAYVQSAVCSPSRNSLLSGLRPNTTGLRGFGTHLRDVIPDIITLPQHFKQNGYESRAFGKIYHIYVESMMGNEDDPKSWSAPQQLPTVPVWGPEQNALRNRLIKEAKEKGIVFDHPHKLPRGEVWDDSDIPDDEMQDGNITAMAEEYLASKKNSDQPFFLAVGYMRPHLPFNAPKKYWDLYDPAKLPMPTFRDLPHGAPQWTMNRGMVRNYSNMPPLEEVDEDYKRRFFQAYLACISYVDACVGRLLKALEDSGHADNTIIVFLGDHGYQVGEYDSWGHKHSNFEISTRAPLLVHAPGMKQAGKGTTQLTEFLDLYPTLCDLAELKKPAHLEGESFAQLLNDPKASHRDAACSEMNRRGRLGRSIRTKGFRYTEWRDKKNKIVARELYDHRNDKKTGRLEKVNVVKKEELANINKWLSKKLNKAVPHQEKKTVKLDPILKDMEIIYVKRSMKGFYKAKNPTPKMAALGFPSNHESHSSLDKLGYDNEIVVHNLKNGAKRTIYKPENKEFVGHIDLHWDGKRLLFTKSSAENWEIWEINIDGTGLRRVSNTPKDVDCYEPCYLPDGRIILSSNAGYQCVPCWHGKEKKFVANLYIMNSDGSGMRRLCFDQDHDSNPFVGNDGRIIFSRWDYTGMNRLFNRPLIVMNPDGTGQRAFYGSNSWFPNALYAPRELPGTAGKFVSILSGYHGSYKSGHLVTLNIKQGRKETEGITQRISGQGLPLEVKYMDRLTELEYPKFFMPYPVTDHQFLVTARMKQDSKAIGIYLADTTDKVQLVHKEEGYGLFEATPVMKRKKPPVIPDRINTSKKDSVVYIQDIYEGLGLQGVPRGTIKDLRVISYNFGYIGLAGNDKIGLSGPWEGMNILGTAPVEKDGSLIFKIPANTPVAFQALDTEGKAVQLMRTWVTAMPGEYMSCVGCHESAADVPPPKSSIALKGKPRDLTPWYGPARGFDFAREVQPVLNKHCIVCHSGRIPGFPDLRPEEQVKDYEGLVPGRLDNQRMHPEHRKQYGGKFRYTPAYETLIKYIRRVNVGDEVSLLDPGHYHADTSELIQMLQQGHKGVKLDKEGWDRLITWIDLNGPCHGTWADVFKRPVLDNQSTRRMELAKMYGESSFDPEIIPDTPPYTGKGKPIPNLPSRKINQSEPIENNKPEFKDLEIGNQTIRMAKVPGEKPFWISVCEISNDQFKSFDPTHDSWFYTKRHAERGDDRGIPLNNPDQPVMRVSWNKAKAFCAWASEISGHTVSLPTEEQWEYACNAGARTPMLYGRATGDFSSWANFADKTFGTFGYTGKTTYFQIGGDVDYIDAEGVSFADKTFDDKHCVTAPIGTYKANKLGIKDMHGNAAEWTATDQAGEKIVKGGSYLDRPERGTVESRTSYPPWQKVYNVGFRIIME